MTETRKKLRAEITELVAEGNSLLDDEYQFWADFDADQSTTRSYHFGVRYHPWYSKSLPLVRQLQPDRAEEFELYFRDTRIKQMTLSTYTIQDHISGVFMRAHKQSAWAHQALTKFSAQISIVAAILQLLDSALLNVESVLQSELLDDELDVARDLLSKKHVRAAGSIAGVVLERHLKTIATNREIKIKKNANLGAVNNALKDGSVYGTPEWRRIQHLADVRNYCVHQKERDPTPREIDDLVKETDRIVKTVF